MLLDGAAVPLRYENKPTGWQKNWLYVPAAILAPPPLNLSAGLSRGGAQSGGTSSVGGSVPDPDMLFLTWAQPLTFVLADTATGRTRPLYVRVDATPGLPQILHNGGGLLLLPQVPADWEGAGTVHRPHTHRFLAVVHHSAKPYTPRVQGARSLPFYRDWMIELELRGVRPLSDDGNDAHPQPAPPPGGSDSGVGPRFSARVTRCSSALVMPTVSRSGAAGPGGAGRRGRRSR